MKIGLLIAFVALTLNCAFAQQWQLKGNILIKTDGALLSNDPSGLLVPGSKYVFAFGIQDVAQSIFLWGIGMNDMGSWHPIIKLYSGLQIQKSGRIYCGYDDIPLTYIQLKSSSDSLPLPLRNKWQDAVVVFDTKQELSKSATIPISNLTTRIPDGMSYARAIRIMWDGDEDRYGQMIRNFPAKRDLIEIRRMEVK